MAQPTGSVSFAQKNKPRFWIAGRIGQSAQSPTIGAHASRYASVWAGTGFDRKQGTQNSGYFVCTAAPSLWRRINTCQMAETTPVAAQKHSEYHGLVGVLNAPAKKPNMYFNVRWGRNRLRRRAHNNNEEGRKNGIRNRFHKNTHFFDAVSTHEVFQIADLILVPYQFHTLLKDCKMTVKSSNMTIALFIITYKCKAIFILQPNLSSISFRWQVY